MTLWVRSVAVRPRRFFVPFLAALLFAGIATAADFQTDSLALLGAWRWVRSEGGQLGAYDTPPPTGWSRVMYFRQEGSFAFWEEDSVADYLLCSGSISVNRPGRLTGAASFWIQLPKCQALYNDDRYLVTRVGPDTISMYPGAGDMVVSDALTDTYVRERARAEPARSRSPYLPPRIRTALPGSYYVRMSLDLLKVAWTFGPLHAWGDQLYPSALLDKYHYTNHQIPAAVIGDFDGDSLADVAIYGRTEGSGSNVVCVLSNHEKPRAVLLLGEADPISTDAARGRPRPQIFLTLIPARAVIRDSDGKAVALPTDAILVSRTAGEATPFYMEWGSFREGRPIRGIRWDKPR